MALALVACQNVVFAQNDGQDLLKSAKRGDEKAMYDLGMSLLRQGGEENVKDAYSWIKKSAEKDYAPSQAAMAYFLRNGVGTDRDLNQAWYNGNKAAGKGDGLASWILAQLSKDRGYEQSMINDHLKQALGQEYPIAKLFFAKGYAEGNQIFVIQKDETRSRLLLQELDKAGIADASALLGIQQIDSPQIAFAYLKKAADAGMAGAASLVGSMYYHGEGIGKNPAEAFKYFEKAAELKDPAGMEGLADCYRTGVGTGVFQERAFNLYAELKDPSPRVMYILGCYYNEGISTAKDPKKAAELFEKAAARGNVFAQAVLGIAHYEGSAPFEEKDFDKAYSYLTKVLENEAFGQVTEDVAAKVYECAARCVRFGRGGAVKSKEEADKLQEKADALSESASSKSFPFGSIGLASFKESVAACDISWASLKYEDILERVTFDYPKDYLNKTPEPVEAEQPKPAEAAQPKRESQTVILSEAKDLPNQQTVAPTPKTPKAPKAAKSGRLAIMIEASPYCFAPTSVISSRDHNKYWLNGSAIDLSALIGWLSESGLFIGGGAGFESFSGGRMSVIQGFVDARYFMGGSGSGLFFGARGGVGMGSPEYGIGITAAGMLGYKIAFGGNMGLNIGLKAGINSFTDESKTMGNVVGPFVGVSF